MKYEDKKNDPNRNLYEPLKPKRKRKQKPKSTSVRTVPGGAFESNRRKH